MAILPSRGVLPMGLQVPTSQPGSRGSQLPGGVDTEEKNQVET